GQQAQGKVAAELLPVPRRQEGQMETVGDADHVLSLVVFLAGKNDAARYWREPRGRCGSEGGRLGALTGFGPARACLGAQLQGLCLAAEPGERGEPASAGASPADSGCAIRSGSRTRRRSPRPSTGA